MRGRCGWLVGALGLLLLGGTAWAGGEELNGYGFRARVPAGFRVDSRDEQAGGCVLTLRRSLPEHGELVLVLTSHEQEEAALARTEQQLGRTADVAVAESEVEGAEARVTDAHVPGAEEGYEMIAQGEGGSRRILSARLGGLLVGVTLDAGPGAEEEAEEAWRLATGSLRVDAQSGMAGTFVLWALGALIVVAVLVTLVKRAGRVPPIPARRAPEPAPPAPPLPRDPAPSGTAAAHARPRGAGFSRPDDGLPTFTAAAKAGGVTPDEALELLRPAPEGTPPRPLPAPTLPSRAPNLTPRAPVVRTNRPG